MQPVLVLAPPTDHSAYKPAPLPPLQVLAAFLKSIGFIIPLMDAMYANYYTREVMIILIRWGGLFAGLLNCLNDIQQC